MAQSKVLVGRKAICNYLDISKNTFYTLIKAGLPAAKQAGTWVSHVDVLEEYFRKIALKRDMAPGDRARKNSS